MPRKKLRQQWKEYVPPIKQEPKPFCPRSKIRYDGAIGEYKTRWACTMCLCCCLTQNAAGHLLTCIPHSRPETKVQTARQDVPYFNCEFCERVFSRYVILKKHLKTHKNENSENVDSDDFL